MNQYMSGVSDKNAPSPLDEINDKSTSDGFNDWSTSDEFNECLRCSLPDLTSEYLILSCSTEPLVTSDI